MSNMEFLNINFLNTTTLASCSSGSTTVAYLFDRNISNQFQSSGDDDDATTTTLEIIFPSVKEVDRIVLQNINLKSFHLYYDNTTTNRFSLTSADTGTSVWSQNSATNLFLKLETIKTISSLHIQMTATIDANENKKIGELWITSKILTLEHNPGSQQYKPKFDRKEYTHNMSDGGTAHYIIDKSFVCNMKLTYQSNSMTNALLDIYEDADPFVFVPFPTSSAWEGRHIYEVNWVGDYDFLQPAKNYYSSYGWSGNLRLKETPR